MGDEGRKDKKTTNVAGRFQLGGSAQKKKSKHEAEKIQRGAGR